MRRVGRWWRESVWAGRAIVLLGMVIVVTGLARYGNAPAPSRHYHDDPTPGDLDVYSLFLVCAVGFIVALWGYTRNDPIRRAWRKDRRERTDEAGIDAR